MYLTLEVISSQATSLGPQRRQVVGPKGLTIGRAPENDWVLPDPYISKRHARIRFEGGQFLVEGLGRNPIAIGRADNAIPANEPRLLKVGDRIFFDEYEVLVKLLQREPPGAAPAAAPAAPPPPPPPPPPEVEATERLSAEQMTGPSDDEGLMVQPSSTGLVTTVEPAEDMPASGLPVSDQDELLESRTVHEVPEERPPERRSLPPVPPPKELRRPGPTPVQGPARGQGVAPAIGKPPTRNRSSELQVIPRSASMRVAGPTGPAVARGPSELRASGSARSPAPRTMRTTVEPSSDLALLLKAAGVPERDWSPEIAQELGMILRIAIEGIMGMLRSRADVKSELRLPLTRVQVKENNPLKLCPNVESVLHTLLVQRNPGYLPTAQAFEDAFSDIRNHQSAMFEGLRAAFDSMFASFEPEHLKKGFRVAAKGGVLGGKKARYWDLYVQRYEHLGENVDESFRRLFGEVFAEAYERHLERMKHEGDAEDQD